MYSASEKGTTLSSILGIIGIVFSIHYVLTHPHVGFSGFFDRSAFILICIAPPCVMLLSHSIQDFFTGIRLLVSSMTSRHRKNQNEIIHVLTTTSAIVRTEGLGALVKIRSRVQYELLRDGLSLILNNFTDDEIQHNLLARIETKQTRMALAVNLFENMSKLCPGIGMIGTLIGLIMMLSSMNDPSKLGGGMAIAMLTTLYGLMLGTIVYAPWGEKIALEAERVLELDMMVLEGVINIKSKKSSLHMNDTVRTYGAKPQPVKATNSAGRG